MMKILISFFLFCLVVGCSIAVFLNSNSKSLKLQNDLLIIRNYLLKNTSCLSAYNICKLNKKQDKSLSLFNIFGGEILSNQGGAIGPFYIKSSCSFDENDFFVSLAISRENITYQNSDLFPKGLELCRLSLNKNLLCPSSKILQGFNEVGLPICTSITPFSFQNSSAYECLGGEVLSRINQRDFVGGIEKNVSCKASPLPDPPCPDCPCNEESELAVVPSVIKGLYRDVAVSPPRQSDEFCRQELSSVDALLCEGCLDPSLYGGRWVVSRWSTKLPQCNKRSINDYENAWNPSVLAFYLCKKMTSVNNDYKKTKKENVFKRIKDKNGVKCFCDGVPWRGGDECHL